MQTSVGGEARAEGGKCGPSPAASEGHCHDVGFYVVQRTARF